MSGKCLRRKDEPSKRDPCSSLNRSGSVGEECLARSLGRLTKTISLSCRIRARNVKGTRVSGQVRDIKSVECFTKYSEPVALFVRERLRESKILGNRRFPKLIIRRKDIFRNRQAIRLLRTGVCSIEAGDG